MSVSVKPVGKCRRRDTEVPCPRCKSHMQEVMRAQEDRATYVWYQCPAGSCDYKLLVQYA